MARYAMVTDLDEVRGLPGLHRGMRHRVGRAAGIRAHARPVYRRERDVSPT